MTDASSERVTCPSCGKGYRWQEALVGKVVPCKQCDESFEVPSGPGEGLPLIPQVNEDGIYDLATDDAGHTDTDPIPAAVPAVGGKCPNCNSKVAEHAVLCMNCGFNMREGKRVQTAVVDDLTVPATASIQSTDGRVIEAATRAAQREAHEYNTAEDLHREHRWEELYRPLILLGIGFVFVLISAFALTPMVDNMHAQQGYGLGTGPAILAFLIGFGMTLLMMTPILLGGIFFMASVFGSAFGNLFTALLKLLALVVLIVGVDATLALTLDLITGGFGGLGWFVRLSVLFGVFYPTCAKLFDMESYEVAVMFLLYVIGPMAIGLLAAILLAAFF